MRVRFLDCAFDSATREFLRAGRPINISSKSLELLELLLAGRPQSISRDELRARLWPGADPAEGSLAALVLELRGALEDKGQGEAISRTQLGYAFTAPARDDHRPTVLGAGFRYRLFWDDREIALEEGENVIGRDYDVALRIDEGKVSRRHACLRIAGDRATLEDLGSRNGTFHNDRRVERPVALSDGDRISIGKVFLVFRSRSSG